MLTTIAKIFGKSPFAPLQAHMEKVSACIEKLPLLLPFVEQKNKEKILEMAKEISRLEHEADLTKNDIRNHLPSTLFMPISRATLLEILSYQDAFADIAEDIAVLLSFKTLEFYQPIKDDFEMFFLKNLETFFLTRQVIKEFDTLLESSFGGIEAQKVKQMIEELALKEHEIDVIQFKLISRLYNEDITSDYKDFNMALTLIKEVGSISNLSEKLGNRIRMILEIKE